MNKERAKLHGRVHVLVMISTQIIIAGKYKFKTNDMRELARHAFEDIDPEFIARVQPGDIVVAGNNFGCGSSRSRRCWYCCTALVPLWLLPLPESFPERHTGLPVLQCPVEGLQTGSIERRSGHGRNNGGGWAKMAS